MQLAEENDAGPATAVAVRSSPVPVQRISQPAKSAWRLETIDTNDH